VGGAIPIDRTVTTAAGNQNFSDVFFQEFGITLAVRPLVGDDDMITMDVSPDISFPDPVLTAALDEGTTGGASTAAFETRTLSTSTRLADGDVLAIGGLLQQQESVDSTYTPGAHAVPGFGWLTKSLQRNRDETEVVILVSPAIVRDRIPGVELWAYPNSSELLVGLLEEPPSP
jgi:type II secretory pathway component GspD/PulD (secretin)